MREMKIKYVCEREREREREEEKVCVREREREHGAPRCFPLCAPKFFLDVCVPVSIERDTTQVVFVVRLLFSFSITKFQSHWSHFEDSNKERQKISTVSSFNSR